MASNYDLQFGTHYSGARQNKTSAELTYHHGASNIQSQFQSLYKKPLDRAPVSSQELQAPYNMTKGQDSTYKQDFPTIQTVNAMYDAGFGR